VFDRDAAEAFVEDFDSNNVHDIIFEIRQDLTNASFALNAIYQICSGTVYSADREM
jgi:hypothetical protein